MQLPIAFTPSLLFFQPAKDPLPPNITLLIVLRDLLDTCRYFTGVAMLKTYSSSVFKNSIKVRKSYRKQNRSFSKSRNSSNWRAFCERRRFPGPHKWLKLHRDQARYSRNKSQARVASSSLSSQCITFIWSKLWKQGNTKRGNCSRNKEDSSSLIL